MGAISVTATVRDSTGATGTATATATIADDPGSARAAQLKPAGPYWPGDLGGSLVGLYSAAERSTPRTRVASLAPVAGQTYRDLIVDNLIYPAAGTGFCDFENVQVRGASAPTSYTGLARVYNDSHPILRFRDCELDPAVASPFWIGVHGWGVEMERCRVRRVVDGASVFNRPLANRDGNVRVAIRRSLFEDLAYFLKGVAGEPTSDGSHSDALAQWQGGSGLILEYNDVRGWIGSEFGLSYYGTRHVNALIMIKPDDGNIGPGRIVGNRFEGGSSMINVSPYDKDSAGVILRRILDLGECWGNTFVKGSTRQYGGNGAIVVPHVRNAAGAWTPAPPPCDWGSGLTPGSTSPPNVWSDGTLVTFSNGGAA